MHSVTICSSNSNSAVNVILETSSLIGTHIHTHWWTLIYGSGVGSVTIQSRQEKATRIQMLRGEYVTEDKSGGAYTGIFSLKSKDERIFVETLKHICVCALFHTAYIVIKTKKLRVINNAISKQPRLS